MSKKRIRIKDIAVAAGVSAGTVDRVIHNRGNVKPAIEKKVRQVMQALDYQPNILASTLANNKVTRIGVVLPDHSQDAFWQFPVIGIHEALKVFSHFLLEISYYYFDENNPQSFDNQATKVLEDSLDGLILAPIFSAEATRFLTELALVNTPVVLVNTHLPDTNKLTYIGQDSYQSGILGARLVSQTFHDQATYWLLHLEAEEKAANAVHIYQKEAGFFSYFNQKEAITIVKKSFNEEGKGESLSEFLNTVWRTSPSPNGIFVSTSKAYQLVKILGPKIRDAVIVGFDLLPENIQYLKSGAIDFIINQNPQKQGYRAVESLVHHLLLKKELPAVQYLPLDIVVKENVSYYFGSIRGSLRLPH